MSGTGSPGAFFGWTCLAESFLSRSYFPQSKAVISQRDVMGTNESDLYRAISCG